MRHIAIIGSISIDRIVQGADCVEKSGGVVVYGGLTLRREGFDVAVCFNMRAGDHRVLRPLQASGVRLLHAASSNTTSFVNYVRGDDRRQEMPRAAAPICKEQVEEACRGAQAVLLGPLHPHDIDEEALVWLAACGLRVAIDIQGYARRVLSGRILCDRAPQIAVALRCARCIKVSRDELALLLDFIGCDVEGLMCSYGIDEVVVTDGSRGGFVHCVGGEAMNYGAVKVERVVDPTGAGDVFFAAYLSRRFYEPIAPVSEAANYAAIRAADQVQGRFIAEEKLLLQN